MCVRDDAVYLNSACLVEALAVDFLERPMPVSEGSRGSRRTSFPRHDGGADFPRQPLFRSRERLGHPRARGSGCGPGAWLER